MSTLKTLCERQISDLENNFVTYHYGQSPRLTYDGKRKLTLDEIRNYLSSCQQELLKRVVELCNEFQYKRCKGVSYLTEEIRKAIIE